MLAVLEKTVEQCWCCSKVEMNIGRMELVSLPTLGLAWISPLLVVAPGIVQGHVGGCCQDRPVEFVPPDSRFRRHQRTVMQRNGTSVAKGKTPGHQGRSGKDTNHRPTVLFQVCNRLAKVHETAAFGVGG